MVAVLRRVAPVLLVALAPALSARAETSSDTPSDTIILQLSGPAQFEYAGYFAALWQGYYKEAGITVEIRPGSPPGQGNVDPAHEVGEGHAQFGVGSMRLVTQAAQGLPLLLLAPVFQTSGAEIYYRADSDFGSPGALLRGKIGRLPATDPLELEMSTALRGDGIDPGKLVTVPVDSDQAVAALADRRVDAIVGSAWDFPWAARARTLPVKSFDPADYRVEFYGDTLFTLARFERSNPALVEHFREASLKGWTYALDHPDEVAARLVSDLPPPPGIADSAGFNRYQITVAQVLSRYPTVAIGHSSPERWSRIEENLAGVGALVAAADPDSFVYDPDRRARGRADWRDGMILALAALLAVAVAAALFLRRRRAAPAAPLSLPAPTVVPLPVPVRAPPAEIAAGIGPEPKPPAEPAAPPEPPPPTDLNAILTELEGKIRERVPARASFRLSLVDELWPCRTDADAVSALVLDLVAAAVAQMRPDDTLIVGTRNAGFTSDNVGDVVGGRIGEFARITVRDSGSGFSETQLERIFDPTASARPAVAAAWPAMNKLGGYVRVESAEGVGTAIHLYFPREEKPAAAAIEPAPRRYKASGSRSIQRRSRSLR
jgi:ABC-type nitrate/sulfonate/bicarbonate transport system substrate-binding protein